MAGGATQKTHINI